MIPKYISNPGEENNTGYGTGGTSYTTYLGTLRNVTESAAINSKDTAKTQNDYIISVRSPWIVIIKACSPQHSALPNIN